MSTKLRSSSLCSFSINYFVQIFGGEDDHILSNDSDLNKISDKLRLVPINEEVEGKVEDKETTEHNAIEDVNLAISDEEFARMLQVLLS